MGKFLTYSAVRDTLVMLLESRVERRRGDSVQEWWEEHQREESLMLTCLHGDQM